MANSESEFGLKMEAPLQFILIRDNCMLRMVKTKESKFSTPTEVFIPNSAQAEAHRGNSIIL